MPFDSRIKSFLQNLPFRKLHLVFIGLLFLISCALFSILIIKGQDGGYGGMNLHMDNVRAINSGEMSFKPHFLFYLVMTVLTFGSTNIQWIWLVGIPLLGICMLLKYVIARRYFERKLSSVPEIRYEGAFAASFLFAVAFIFIHSFPVEFSSTMYLGQIMPNLWHNATGIFLLPFALLLYIKGKEFLFEGEGRGRMFWFLTLLGLLNVIAKPVFIIAFLPAFGLMALIRDPFGKKFWMALGIGLISVLPLAGQFLYYYIWGAADAGGRSIVFAPFEVWHEWSDNVLLSLVASVPAPLAYLLLFYSSAKKDREFGFASLIFLFSMLYYALLKEEGFAISQNFAKGAVIANIVLHMVVIGNGGCLLLRKEPKWHWKEFALTTVLLLQVGFGLIYLAKTPFFGPW